MYIDENKNLRLKHVTILIANKKEKNIMLLYYVVLAQRAYRRSLYEEITFFSFFFFSGLEKQTLVPLFVSLTAKHSDRPFGTCIYIRYIDFAVYKKL